MMNEIILSPSNDSNLFVFNVKSRKWRKRSFGGYPKHLGVEHASCLSKDGKLLYLYERWDAMLFMVDLSEFVVIKTMNDLVPTGDDSVMIADPSNKNTVHIIGGFLNKLHFTVNTENEETETVNRFEAERQGAGIVYVSRKNSFFYFDDALALHTFDCDSAKWTKHKNITMPSPSISISGSQSF